MSTKDLCIGFSVEVDVNSFGLTLILFILGLALDREYQGLIVVCNNGCLMEVAAVETLV
jgi:hypothetical protein